MAVRRPGVPTVADVAALAGVSPGTVSKAMNGRGQLRSETRQTMPGIVTLALTSDYRDWGAHVAIDSPGAAA